MLSRELWDATIRQMIGHTLTPEEVVMFEAKYKRLCARTAIMQLHGLFVTELEERGTESLKIDIPTPSRLLHVDIGPSFITVSSLTGSPPSLHGATLRWDPDGEKEWFHVGNPHLPDGYAPWEWAYDALCS